MRCRILIETGNNFELNEFRQIPNWILDELVQPWPSWLWKSSDCDGMGWGEVLPELKLGIQRLELGIPCSRWLLFKLLGSDNCPNLFSGCSDMIMLSPKKRLISILSVKYFRCRHSISPVTLSIVPLCMDTSGRMINVCLMVSMCFWLSWESLILSQKIKRKQD